MARTSITIVLELDEAADSPVGSARLGDGSWRSFHGWLALAETIDSLAGLSTRSDARSIVGGTSSAEGADANRAEGSTSS